MVMLGLRRLSATLAVALALTWSAKASDDEGSAAANPIRKVVTMLQTMQKKVTQEAEKEKELYEKYMCYCKNGRSDLAESISASETKVPSLQSDIKASEEELVQTKESLKQAQTDRAAAKATMAEATAMREKEAKAFLAEKAELDADISAVLKATSAVEKGMAGGFLQTGAALILKRVVMTGKQEMIDGDRQELLAFLSGDSQYAPASGEVVGILKNLGEEMQKNLADITSAEKAAKTEYEELMQAKKKEVEALTSSIEAKLLKVGELGVAIAGMKNDLSDSEEALIEDKKFLAGLEKGCSTKTAEWEERQKTRAQELVALSETIKLLNDDDALDLFKKTLPGASASSSFVQVGKKSILAVQKRARDVVQQARWIVGADKSRLDLIGLALHGQKIGFDKVIQMIDEMVASLKKEQVDDDSKKEYCAKQFDLSDDKKKSLEQSVEDRETGIANAEESISTLADELKALQAGIKALDRKVMEATEQRKQEHEEFAATMADNSAAKELLGFAKNRLNKFYNPKLYRPSKTGLMQASRISLIEISEHVHESTIRHHDAPPPPPETYGAYSKKSEESTGVIQMIELLITDLDKDMTEAETEEKQAQEDYQGMMADSSSKRATDAKAITDKAAAKAQAEGDLEMHKEAKASTEKELMATEMYIKSLHAECDWLVKYYDMRKEARAGEIDALGKAKAILKGADFSFLQSKQAGFLGRRM